MGFCALYSQQRPYYGIVLRRQPFDLLAPVLVALTWESGGLGCGGAQLQQAYAPDIAAGLDPGVARGRHSFPGAPALQEEWDPALLLATGVALYCFVLACTLLCTNGLYCSRAPEQGCTKGFTRDKLCTALY